MTAKIDSLLHQLWLSPLPIPKDADGYSSFFTATDALFLVSARLSARRPYAFTLHALTPSSLHAYFAQFLSSLYNPPSWQILAQAFAMAIEGDGVLLRALYPLDPTIVRGDRSLANENIFNRTTGGGFENGQTIYCADQANDGPGWQPYRNGSNDAWVGLLERVSTGVSRRVHLPQADVWLLIPSIF